MCANGSGVHSPAQWAGKTVGVTDIGSGTDNLTVYLATRNHLPTQHFNRAAVGAGSTFVAALQNHRIACGMTTQPTAGAIQSKGIGYSAINLATTAGAQQWLGGVYPGAGRARAGRLGCLAQGDGAEGRRRARRHDALDPHPHRRADRQRDASAVRQQRPDHQGRLHRRARRRQGAVPARRDDAGLRAATALAVDKFVGNVTSPVNLAAHLHQPYAIAANKLEGYTK